VEQFAKYLNDPVGFAREVLGIELVPKQQEAITSILKPPYRTLIPSANEQGKSLLCACAVLWWHCTRLSIIVTTAPKYEQVRDVIWKEVRRLAANSKLAISFLPKACRIERNPDDFATGTTAKDSTSFQGQHGASLLFILDESTGIESEMFDAVEGMFSPPGHAILAPFNPTAMNTRVYTEMMYSERLRKGDHGGWHVVRMSALDHPNIRAQLEGKPAVVEHAMRLDKFERLLKRWSRPVGCDLEDKQGLHKSTDIVWPPAWAADYCKRTSQRPTWLRPGPMAEARLLGRYPTQGVDNVWSDGAWQSAIPEIGVDVAAFGSDFTAIHVRCGCCSLHHEEINGQSEPDTMARLVELAKFYRDYYNTMLAGLPQSAREGVRYISEYDIPLKIDNDGLGGTLSSFMLADGYRVIRIGASSKALEELNYPNRRSELWFATAEMAADDQVDFSRLPEEVIDNLHTQLMQVTWAFDSRGRRLVMPKDEMRQKMGRSPDTGDACNLAYSAWPEDLYGDAVPEVLTRRRNPLAPHHEQAAPRQRNPLPRR